MPDIAVKRISDGGNPPRLNLVFLHGLGGELDTTWRHGNGFFWPYELAEDFNGLAVYSIGYPADKASWNSGWPISQAAVAVLDRLIADRTLRASKTPIVFICHSLGGLIVKKLILTAQSDRGQDSRKGAFLDRVVGIVFLATPHSGSIMAKVASQLHWFVSDSMRDLNANDANLLDLSVNYRNCIADNGARIRHHVYYETEGIWGSKPVNAMSADPGITGVRPIGIGRDHIAICKVPSRTDEVYEGVLAFVEDVLAPPSPTPGEKIDEILGGELSAALKKKKKQARAASRKHNVDSALRLWDQVRKQAQKEGNNAEELGARFEVVLALARDEGNLNEALKRADDCLRDAKNIDLGKQRCRLLQLFGEVHRIKGNKDQARGFINKAIEHARKSGSLGDEGIALLSLAALERTFRGSGDNTKALNFIELAYNAFSTLYASGDEENQKCAKDGFAQCHCLRAEILGYTCSDDALPEWTRALELFQSLGEGWEWDVADTFLRRADLRGRVDEQQLAAADLDRAAKIFQRIGNTTGLAKCYLEAGELLDSAGKRDEAADQYQQAAAIATTWKNDRRASYYYFRHACKLVELQKYGEAEGILVSLAKADWLEQKHKLTVISQLCLVAHVTKNDTEFKERCSLALSLIDELIEEAPSPDERRSLLIEKAQHLERLGQHDQALQFLNKAIERFEKAGDQEGVIECWSHIRSVMQRLNDRKKEREAAEKVLALGAEKLCPMIAAITLVMLAQLNIDEQRFSEASAQLDRAHELDPRNPAVRMIAADLRSKLPQLSLEHQTSAMDVVRPPSCDLPSLIKGLHYWCACYPSKRESILAVWYYIHRSELWSILRSMLGLKFLICAAEVAKFEIIKTSMRAQGDLFLWGTNFALKTKRQKGVTGIEQIPVPKGFMIPAGVTLITAGGADNTANESEARKRTVPCESEVLVPRTGDLPVKPYYLAPIKRADGSRGLVFVGRKQDWVELKVVKFMLDRSAKELIADKSICLPLGERGVLANLRRTMQVAWEIGAIPVFSEHLPHNEEISAVCDTTLELPTGDKAPFAEAKELWATLLTSCPESPKSSLTDFSKKMAALLHAEPINRLAVRVYMLRFQAGSQEVIHPGVVVVCR